MYNSPIEKIFGEIQNEIMRRDEEHLMTVVSQNVGYVVDKTELLKALQYDRGQYEKGYADAKAVYETRWIPVSERLPNKDEYIKNNGLFIVSDGNRSYSEWYDIYDKQKFGEPTMDGFRVDYGVAYWMPLPVGPYEEKKEHKE